MSLLMALNLTEFPQHVCLDADNLIDVCAFLRHAFWLSARNSYRYLYITFQFQFRMDHI